MIMAVFPYTVTNSTLPLSAYLLNIRVEVLYFLVCIYFNNETSTYIKIKLSCKFIRAFSFVQVHSFSCSSFVD